MSLQVIQRSTFTEEEARPYLQEDGVRVPQPEQDVREEAALGELRRVPPDVLGRLYADPDGKFAPSDFPRVPFGVMNAPGFLNDGADQIGLYPGGGMDLVPAALGGNSVFINGAPLGAGFAAMCVPEYGRNVQVIVKFAPVPLSQLSGPDGTLVIAEPKPPPKDGMLSTKVGGEPIPWRLRDNPSDLIIADPLLPEHRIFGPGFAASVELPYPQWLVSRT